ncbi:MAG: LapA family protein [Firmicutes bacterium]|nr:LapA family protein [Bacillota bacterium]
MGRFNIVLALVLCLIIAVFASANSQPVEVNYLYGVVETSAVLIILGSAALGALAVFIFGLFKNIVVKLQLRALNQEIKNLQEKLQITKKERDTFLAQVGRLQGTLVARERESPGSHQETDLSAGDKGSFSPSGNNIGAQQRQQQAGEAKEC